MVYERLKVQWYEMFGEVVKDRKCGEMDDWQKLLAIVKKYSLESWIQVQTALRRAVIDLSERYGHRRTIFEQLCFYKKSFGDGRAIKSGVG